MKLISFLVSLLIHAFFILFFILILKSPIVAPKKIPVYTVSLVNLKENKPKPKPAVKKIKFSFTKPNVKKKHAVVVPKPKPQPKKPIKKSRPKAKIKREKPTRKVKRRTQKPNVEQKVKLLKEKVKLEQIKEQLLREKIEAIKRNLMSQKEANTKFAGKLAKSYMSIIKGIIYSNWGVEKSVIKNNVLAAKVKIKLDYRGNLVNLSVVKSSGNAYFDGTVVAAVRDSQPFPAPPKEILEGGFVSFIINFDSREKE